MTILLFVMIMGAKSNGMKNENKFWFYFSLICIYGFIYMD